MSVDEDNGSWWAEFHLQCFWRLTMADANIERRELVWMKSFFSRRGYPDIVASLSDTTAPPADLDDARFDELTALANKHMGVADRRRCVYDLAQMCKSKGSIDEHEYEAIIRLQSRRPGLMPA